PRQRTSRARAGPVGAVLPTTSGTAVGGGGGGGGGVGLVGDRSGGNEAAAHHDDDLARLYVQNLDPLHGNVSSEPPALPVDHWSLLPQRHQRSRPCGIKLADRHPVADAEEAELRR